MEQLTLDAGGGMDPGPHLLVESVNPSDDEEEEDDFERQTPPAGGQPLVARGDATDSDGDSPESSLIVISLDPERKSSMRKRSGSHTPPRMGREASPFFNVLLVFSVVVSVLATFTIGLGAKVELQLGNSHTQWSASLWWGAIVVRLNTVNKTHHALPRLILPPPPPPPPPPSSDSCTHHALPRLILPLTVAHTMHCLG